MTHELDRVVSQLFLSCDLTGSTDFKQSEQRKSGGKATGWQQVFLQFYREFPQELATIKRKMDNADLEFRLWKPIGDELIYSCEVSSEDEVYRAVRTWIAAMKAYKAGSLDDSPMNTKGGGFIATFPSPDSKSSVPRSPDLETSDRGVNQLNRDAYEPMRHEDYLYDYFGPSVDTGFRLFTRSSLRYFPISVEVALAMIGRSRKPGSEQANFHVKDLVLLEFAELKGVWDGKRYPIVAIDLDYDHPVNKAYSKFESRRGDADSDIEELCLACYEEDDWPSQLYLPGAVDDRFRVEPEPPAEPADISPVGVEEKAAEPDDPQELSDDPPLGDAKYRTGFVQLKLAVGLPDSEVRPALKSAAESELGTGEFLSRLDVQPPIPSSEAGKAIYSAYWGSMRDVGEKAPPPQV